MHTLGIDSYTYLGIGVHALGVIFMDLCQSQTIPNSGRVIIPEFPEDILCPGVRFKMRPSPGFLKKKTTLSSFFFAGPNPAFQLGLTIKFNYLVRFNYERVQKPSHKRDISEISKINFLKYLEIEAWRDVHTSQK